MKRNSLHEIAPEGVAHNPEIEKRVLLRIGDVPHVTQLARSRFRPGQATACHAHADMVEVFLVETGEGEIRIDGKALALREGVCVVVEAGERHEVVCGPGGELSLTYFGIRL